MEVPTHPGAQQPQQQAPATGADFFRPSASLAASNQQIAQKQAPQQGLGAPVQPQQPQVSPEQVQAEQMAEAISNGQLQGDQLQALANQDPAMVPVIQAAVTMAEQRRKATEAQYNQQQGLGEF